MAATIVSLRNSEALALTGEAAPEIIQLLEDWLAMAKRGELTAIGLVGARPTHAFVTAFENTGVFGNDLVAGTTVLLHRLAGVKRECE